MIAKQPLGVNHDVRHFLVNDAMKNPADMQLARLMNSASGKYVSASQHLLPHQVAVTDHSPYWFYSVVNVLIKSSSMAENQN